MPYRNALILTISLMLMMSSLMATTNPSSSTSVQRTDRMSLAAAKTPFVLIEPGPTYMTRKYSDHSVSEMKTLKITVPFSGSDTSAIAAALYKEQMQIAFESFATDNNKRVVGGETLTSLNVVFNLGGSVPPDAVTALETAAKYLEGLFSDPVTVLVNINFAVLGSGILGSTSVYYTATPPSWTDTRASLVAGMDADDYVQTYLPDGSTIPVRYDGASSEITDEDQCDFAWANYGAAIGTISGASADITFSSQISWDYDPTNGVPGDKICFQSVVLHEIGHALGFVSHAESWYQPNSDISSLDIYRFQRTDGSGDYNPDDISEFQVRPRLVDYNNPDNDHNSNLFTSAGADIEYRMSDGTPYQASHFLQGVVNGIMQPAIGYGETRYPNFYRTPDIDMFDAIGWDYIPNVAPAAPSNPAPADSSTNIHTDAVLSWTSDDPNTEDVVTYDVYFGASDPPAKISNKQSAPFYVPTAPLDHYKSYYWRIIAWDNHGAGTSGPVWMFTTAPLCGDVTGDLTVNISDAVYLIAYIFAGALPPDPLAAGNVNCDVTVNISDAVYLIAYIFSGGSAPCAGCR